MRVRWLLPLTLASATFIALALAGCDSTTSPESPDLSVLSKPKPIDPGPPARPEPPHGNRAATPERPIKGTFKNFEPIWVVSHFHEDVCGDIVAGAEVKSRGNVAHLGLTWVTASAAWDWAVPAADLFTPTGPASGPSATILPGAYDFCSQDVTATGLVTLVAANGDSLYGVVSGGEVYELAFDVAGDGQEQFIAVEVDGGTGRFVDADGHFVIHSIFHLVDMEIVQSSIMPGGRISY